MVNQISPFPPARPSTETSGTTTTNLRGRAHLTPDKQIQGQGQIPPPRARLDENRSESGGFREILEEGFGRVRLPDTIQLVAALEAARDHAGLADKAVPGLGRLVTAVIDDETRKLQRYLDLRGQ